MKVVDSITGKNDNASFYIEFGKNRTTSINQQVIDWLEEQSFKKKAPSSRFGTIEIKGDSEGIEWDLRFEHQIDRSLNFKSTPEKSLSDALLHVKRLPDLREYNNEPRNFSTADYIQIGISFKEKGWIGEGKFPKGVFMAPKTIYENTNNPKIIDIPAFKDTKKQAEAAFIAAREWAKFRTMTVACSDYIIEQLEQERKDLSERHKKIPFNGDELYNLKELRRSRIERTIPLMLELLPDTRIQTGTTSLKSYYEPGFLEAVVALEMEKATSAQFGKKSNYLPVILAKGSPIEIISNPKIKNGYDAIMSFVINSYGDFKDKKIKEIIEKELQKYFDIKIQNDRYNLKIGLHIPDAYKIRAQINEGSQETYLHKQIRSLVDVLTETCKMSRLWEEVQMPVLKAASEGMVKAGKEAYFGRLEQNLRCLGINPKN